MNELTCPIVRDLLPPYAEKLTSEETNAAVEAHLDTCEGCAKYYASCSINLSIPMEKPTASDRKIIRGMKLKLLWYLFWPMLYGASWQFGWQDRILRLMIFALPLIFIPAFYSVLELNFDPEKRKEFYRREQENLNAGRGTSFAQAAFLAIPILIPLLFWLVPILMNL
ncbi:zf-HC2 domain-containing protein [Oscillospiraceae bacterium PP1C4]